MTSTEKIAALERLAADAGTTPAERDSAKRAAAKLRERECPPIPGGRAMTNDERRLLNRMWMAEVRRERP